MTPEHFDHANVILKAPDCADLPAFRDLDQNLHLTCWRPSQADLQRLIAGEPVWLAVSGRFHPPVALTTEFPFV